MKRLRAALLILAVLPSVISVFSEPAYAHGTGYRTPQSKPAALEFYYSTGEAMAYQEAKVYSPKDEKFAFQSGRTDEHGRFAFTPDSAGQWRVIVQDMEGHLTEAAVDVSDEGRIAPASEAEEEPSIIIRGVLGVSLLFNIAAFTLIYRRRVKKVFQCISAKVS